MRLLLRCIGVVLVLLAGAGNLEAAETFDPALRFRTLTTPHFFVHYHQGTARLALRLATIAEDVRAELEQSLGVPSSRTHVVLADQTELANGWATPLPYNTIVIYPAWPAGSDFIGHTDDWLRLVFVHEFTHIAHLDRSGGWARAFRTAFGRVPLAFPNLFLPVWQIEGLASYQESQSTGLGYAFAADFTAIVGQAARAGTLEPIDRVSGGMTDWPGGHGAYAYGLGFHAYLAQRFGAERLRALADETAGTLPYLGVYAFFQIFGEYPDRVWKDFLEAEAQRAAAAARPSASAATRLTSHGFQTTGPRFVPEACSACPPDIVYSSRTPHEFPTIRAIHPDGTRPRMLTTRYLGSTAGVTDRLVVFDQQEIRRNVGLYSDLHLLDRDTGQVTPLTVEARLLDPDLSRDGLTIVAVRQERGERHLVVMVLGESYDGERYLGPARTLAAEDDTQFNAPRWSPDGSQIVAERHRPNALPEIVIVDPSTGAVRVAASSVSHRIVTPAWRPDGGAVIAAADYGGVFNIFEFPLAGADDPLLNRQLTFVEGGATWPDVSPDGSTLAFVGYTTDGFDIFVTPYAPLELPTPEPPDGLLVPEPGAAPTGGPDADTAAASAGAVYRPWHTLRPTSWTPIITLNGDQLRVGAAVSGVDVLRYHAIRARVTWLADVAGRDPRPRPVSPDFALSYVYDRWRPAFFVAASTTTTLLTGPLDKFGVAVRGARRERSFEAGVSLVTRRVRSTRQALVSVRRETLSDAVLDQRQHATSHLLRAGWALTTAHQYGYSISPEDGWAVGATAQWSPDASDEAAVTTLTIDGRVYLPGLARHHVVAARGAVGGSYGPIDARRALLLGGADSASGVLNFDRNAIALLRGFGANAFAGSRVALVNLDYRLPIATPQRGYHTWPLLLHTLHGAAFVDIGHVWHDTFRAGDFKQSAGGEVSVDVVAGYGLRLTVAAGAAWTRDGANPAARGVVWFARAGRAF